uniref:Uncharacterized protein n=1 Tax=Ralstonia solanacearum TaxID=305 RepID=A0A0S4U961_RALSL|nr:protein of unknown function [Ralstonia solanacearum]
MLSATPSLSRSATTQPSVAMAPRNTDASAVIGAFVGGVAGNPTRSGAGRAAVTAATAHAGTAAPRRPRIRTQRDQEPRPRRSCSLGWFFGLKWPV